MKRNKSAQRTQDQFTFDSFANAGCDTKSNKHTLCVALAQINAARAEVLLQWAKGFVHYLPLANATMWVLHIERKRRHCRGDAARLDISLPYRWCGLITHTHDTKGACCMGAVSSGSIKTKPQSRTTISCTTHTLSRKTDNVQVERQLPIAFKWLRIFPRGALILPTLHSDCAHKPGNLHFCLAWCVYAPCSVPMTAKLMAHVGVQSFWNDTGHWLALRHLIIFVLDFKMMTSEVQRLWNDCVLTLLF
jgi:hypothetical protein